MRRRISRRQMLGWSGFGAASLLHAPFIGGCSSESDSSSDADGAGGTGAGGADGGDVGGAFELPIFDPERPWWHQYNFAPVDEREELDLEIEGALPPELDGLYVRNGSNPANGDNGHWFLGDGMVHGVRIKDGQALWYRNRYVETNLYTSGNPLGVPAGGDNQSNVSVIHHAGRLLTSGEVGFPYELSKEDLSTVGVHDFDGKLETWFTAHPKIDHVTGEMLAFGYYFAEPYLTFHRIDATGALVQSIPIEGVAGPSMMHDFQITETHVVFMDMPILFDSTAVDTGFPFSWQPEYGARIGVMPRDGTGTDVVWVEVDTCYIFHTLNAYDHPTKDGVVVLEAARHSELWVNGPGDFGNGGTHSLHRYEIDVSAGTVTEGPADDRPIEFCQLDRRLVGRPNRYGYAVLLGSSGSDRPGPFTGFAKYDRDRDSSVTLETPTHLEAGEPYFVPAAADAGEDDGYLMTYVYDWAEDRSDLVVWDASTMGADPIARVKLPYRVPFGFHGIWVPA